MFAKSALCIERKFVSSVQIKKYIISISNAIIINSK